MVRNVTYHNPINQEENTPLVRILETDINKRQSTAIDARQASYVIDLAKASFGAVTYPPPGSQWYAKKISGVWTLMARASQQNPQLNVALTPQPGDTVIGQGGTTFFVDDVSARGDFGVTGDLTVAGNVFMTGNTKQLVIGAPSTSTASVAVERATATDFVLSSYVTGDTQRRLMVRADGRLQWGAGGASAVDTNLYRNGVAQLRTEGEIQANGSTATNNGFSTFVTGDAQLRWQVEFNGVQWWGSGSGSVDTNLYRSAADTLKTDDSFIVAGALATLTAVTATGTVNVTSAGDLQYNSVSLPRGIVGYVVSTADSAAITTGTALQTGTLSFPTGRAYRITHGSSMLGNTPGNTPQFFLRAGTGSPTGGTVGFMRASPVGSSVGIWNLFQAIMANTTGSTISGTAAAVIVSGTGNTTEKADSSNPAPRYILVEDIGPASLASGASAMS